jgi:hypothetical protein
MFKIKNPHSTLLDMTVHPLNFRKPLITKNTAWLFFLGNTQEETSRNKRCCQRLLRRLRVSRRKEHLEILEGKRTGHLYTMTSNTCSGKILTNGQGKAKKWPFRQTYYIYLVSYYEDDMLLFLQRSPDFPWDKAVSHEELNFLSSPLCFELFKKHSRHF